MKEDVVCTESIYVLHNMHLLLLYFKVATFCYRLSAHSYVWPELQQPQPCDQLWWRKQEHHVCGLPRGWTLDVHGRRGLYGSHMGPEVLQRKVVTLWLSSLVNKVSYDHCCSSSGHETSNVRGYSRSTLRSTVSACIPTRWENIGRRTNTPSPPPPQTSP